MSWQQYQQQQQQQQQQRQQQYQQQYQQQQQQQRQQHIASGQAHASYALSHPSVVYSPYQQYSYAAQNSSSNSLQWAYPSSSSVSASTVPAARGKGLSYAELLRRAESQSHPQDASQAQPAASSNPPPPPPPQSYSAPPQAPAYQPPAPQRPSPVISKKWQSPPPTVRPPISNTCFAGSSGSVPAAPTNDGGGGNEDTANYPPNLLKHVERSFAQCKTPEEKNWVQGELRSSIQRAVSENRLWTLNWDTVPLPLNRKRKQKQIQPQKQLQPLSNRKKKKQKKLEKKKAAEERRAIEEQLTKQKKGLSLSTRDLTTMKNSESIRERNLRFGHVTDYSATTSQKLRLQIGNGFEEDIQLNWEELKIKGTCQTLEKEYLRLTSAPDPATVRPETVLKKALMLVLNKYRKEQNYFYLCQQMKSIRQDMSIQHIVNDFAVNVYERNARICIEVGDFSEYNQCQTQLSELYEDRPELEKNRDEFLSFQLYYYMSTKDVSSLMHLIANMSQRSKKDPLVSHALAVRRSLTNHDYVNFFRLYSSATALARCCMKHSTAAMRFRALKTMLKAYRPSIPVSLVSSLLAFPSEDVCAAYLRESGVVLDDSQTKVVVKLCQQPLTLVNRSALLGDDSKDYGITHGQF